jgi:hypothetical protein
MNHLLDAVGDEREHLETIFKRASTDGDFRRRLLSDPRGSVKEATGVDLPASYKFQFVETPPGVDVLIPLPELIDDEVALSEEELESVAGGWCCGCSACTAGCSTCSAVSSVEVE